MSSFVTIFEMGPRDGLQNQKQLISTADKIKLVDLLSECGFRKIEVTSFVSPKWVPQMADATEVLAGIKKVPGISYTALTPNTRGYEGAFAAKVDEVAVFASASEGFSQKNINCSIQESLERFSPVTELAKEHGIPVRGYVSCITDCPYDGATQPEQVAKVAETLFAMGCYEVSLGDTIGAGTPDSISAVLDKVLEVAPADTIAGHYHDTGGRAIENIGVSLEKGIKTFDTSIAGLGGCPYAPGAKGNVDTTSVVAMVHVEGYETGIDRTRLADAEKFARSLKD